LGEAKGHYGRTKPTDFGARIDRDRIGAAGFSLGGYTALAVAGGVTNIKLFIEKLQNLKLDLSKVAPPEFPNPAAFAEGLQFLLQLPMPHIAMSASSVSSPFLRQWAKFSRPRVYRLSKFP
jgi:predicted dienelactone hydrolase